MAKSCCLPSHNTTARRGAAVAPGARTGQLQDDMIPLAGGWFLMGADDAPHPEDGEAPAREVFVNPFALAATAVTIERFAAFVAATGYRTLAERAGSSFVFHAFCDPAAALPAPAQAPWWRQVAGASWQQPFGPNAPLAVAKDHPVTHIAREDAMAYCRWSSTRLPTEAEWEFAARGPLRGQPYPWGTELTPEGAHRCNLWQGDFPGYNSAEDGHAATAPVTAYGPQGFGFYNMTGNVWEWVSDRFTELHSPRPARNPQGPLNGRSFVAKGGSYLCHASYCARYRTSSRQALGADTTTGNLGFRVCALA